MTPKYVRLANILREQIRSSIKTTDKKLPTEAALAKRYGVSRQTVRQALALLKSEGIIKTRQGSGAYIAKAGDKDTSKTIAVLISSDSDYIYPELISNIKATFKRNGYSVRIMVTEDNIVAERNHLQDILKGDFAGVLCEPVKNAYPGANIDLFEKVRDRGTHILFMGGAYFNFPDFPKVKSDDVYGGYLALRTLIKKGHKSVACLFNRDTMSGVERYQGVLMAANDFKAEISDDMCTWYTGNDLKELRRNQNNSFLTDFLGRKGNKVSAVICMNDEIAFYLIKQAKELGINVPEDISVISFDNSYLSVIDDMNITTVAHNAHEPAKSAAAGLVKILNGQLFSSVKLSWHLISRDTDKVM